MAPGSSGDGQTVAVSSDLMRMSWVDASLEGDVSLQDHRRLAIDAVQAIESAIDEANDADFMQTWNGDRRAFSRCATRSPGPPGRG